MIINHREVGARRIWIADGALDTGLVRMLHAHLSVLPFHRNDFESKKYNRYRHLKHEFDVAHLEEHPLVRALHRKVLQGVDELYGKYEPRLFRAYVNDIPYGDMQNPHTDTTPGVTALYYVNERWDIEWHGETLFYDGDEAVAAVSPVPGRLVFFAADIRHRAGTPSRECPPTRLSFAFNFATTEQPL